ncbi:MAG TPA: isoprenylcysteine carboxylmethyltransferase family protein [Pyrinomonadaceae bacterium]|nr:isoprenylcysteine carboxylmethyltransferase family protein [Pyrinomonadaceae bacterium]
MRKGGTWIQRWRVPFGFLSAALFVLLARPRPLTLVVGAAISLVGLALRAWAAGHIHKNDRLATSGPYAYTRNPLYLGSFLLGLGFTVAAYRWELALLFAILFFGIYFPVMRVESATLEGLFGDSFRQYAQQVPLFLPRLSPFRGQSANKNDFDAGLYLRYREYRAGLGLLIAWGLLAFKMVYWK